MQTINKGDGTGTGDSVKLALAKAADNFVETDSRLHDLERSYPRKLRGWSAPVNGFPQVPSAKGSRWTGAIRKGSASFAASSVQSAGLYILPSGKIVAFGGTTTVGYLQGYAVAAGGGLTALGGAYAIPAGVSVMSISAIGDDLFCVIVGSNQNGSSMIRLILSITADGITLVASNNITNLTYQSTYNIRGCRTPNTVFMPAGAHTVSSAHNNVGALQISALPADTSTRVPGLTTRYGSGRPLMAHDVIGPDSFIAIADYNGLDGNAHTLAMLVAGSDRGVQAIDLLPLASGSTGNFASAIALSATRALLKGSSTQGVFAVDIVDGQLQLLSHDIQAAGILGRQWRSVVQQDAVRALVFEQNGDVVVPTVLQLDPATGAISEAGTVPLVFGTSGTAAPLDAVKIGANRVVVIGRSASAAPQCLVEVWDLT